MTLPNEEVWALKRTHEFIRSILRMRLCDFRKMKKEDFERWRTEAYYSIKHFPGDYKIDQKWADEVCKDCHQDWNFHRGSCQRAKPNE